MLSPLFVVLGMALIWSIYWWVAVGVAENRAYAQRRVLSSKGVELTCDQERWAGFPFRFEFSCVSPVVSVEDGLTVHSGNLTVVALAYNPWHMIALIDGPTTVGIKSRSEQHLQHGRVTGSLQVRSNNDIVFSVEVPGMQSQQFGSWSSAIAHARSTGGQSIDIAATVKELDIKTNSPDTLHIDEGNFLGRLDPSLQLTVERIAIKRNDVAYWGSGTLELDHERRPQGKLSTETNNLTGLLDIIEPYLKLNEQQVANLKLVLGLLGKTAKLDLIAQRGELYIGPFKAGILSPLY